MRLDIYVSKNFGISREKAKQLILSGKVIVNGTETTKFGKNVITFDLVEITEMPKYVSRGGDKLESVFHKFNLDASQKICIDIGASTGGFTDFLIKNNARKVYAIDIGRNELADELLNNKKVALYEKTNINSLENLPEKADLIVADLSWISVRDYARSLKRFSNEEVDILILLKPQYEVNRNRLWKGKILKDDEKRNEVLNRIIDWLETEGYVVKGVEESGLTGKEGNQEYFLLLKINQ